MCIDSQCVLILFLFLALQASEGNNLYVQYFLALIKS